MYLFLLFLAGGEKRKKKNIFKIKFLWDKTEKKKNVSIDYYSLFYPNPKFSFLLLDLA